MYITWGLNIVRVRKTGLKVYGLVILSSLAPLVVAVDAQKYFGEITSCPNEVKLPWFTYEMNK